MNVLDDLAALRGLDGAKHALTKLLHTRSESHAVLFYGASGAGKRSMAELLAKAWLCLDKDNPGCGECRSCLSFERGNHPDVLRVAPWGPSSLIKVLAFRDVKPLKDEEHILPLEIFFRTAPIVGRQKVVIIENAERMNANAANALLKTLEEPPPYGRLVLTSASVRQVPPTILSRCLGIACELPTSKEQTEDPLWHLAAGSPGRRHQMEANREAYEKLDQFARGLGSRPRGSALAATDEFRNLAESFAENARGANTEALATLATALRLYYPDQPHWAVIAAEAHRRVLGNGGASYALDMMFAKMLD